jgi:3-oxoacyl-[acyl-carrier protein] reductase
MNIDLKGKRAVICGASRGIGRAIALACAEAGASVSICARGAEALEKTRADMAAHGQKAHAAPCDLAEKDQIDRYIAGAAEALGGIDILVNNASAFATTDDEAGWGGSLAVDLLATVRATLAATPFLEQSGAGAILNISSISAFHPSVRTTPYGVAKAAVVQYTQNRAAALAKQARSSVPAAAGSGTRPITPSFTTRSCARSRSAGWGTPRRSPASRCSSCRRSPIGSPARRSRSMAASSSAAESCRLETTLRIRHLHFSLNKPDIR